MKHLRAAMSVSLVLLLQLVLGVATAGASTGGPADLLGLRGRGRPLALRVRRLAVRPGVAHPGLKAKNPRLKALVYMNASASYAWAQANGADWANLPSGVGYVDATENHPSGSSGTRRAIGSSTPTTRTCG